MGGILYIGTIGSKQTALPPIIQNEDTNMNPNIEKYLAVPSRERFYNLLGDEDGIVVWVDHRDEEESIISEIETCLKTGSLTSEVVDSDNEHGFDFFIEYNGKKKRAPFITLGTHNRQEAIVTLNELLVPDYEVRFCVDSSGSDTLAYIPLSFADWNVLEEKDTREKVLQCFYPINVDSPNMFTDYVYPIRFENGKMVVHRPADNVGFWKFIRSLFSR